MSDLSVISEVIGWLYFFFWAISFYGQIYENWKCKDVQGMSFEFVGLNLTGFLFLSIYSTVGFFDKNAGLGDVEVQDLAFAYNAVLATLVTIMQATVYPRGKNKVRQWCVLFIIGLWGYAIVYGLITLAFKWYTPQDKLNLYSMMGYEKLLISFVKYIPQVFLNIKRRSTKGWSICNIICDFMGGFLSFVQIFINALDSGDSNIFDGNLNIVKFVLSIIAMFFDIVFLAQHYIIYPQKNGLVKHFIFDRYQLLSSAEEISIQNEPVKIAPLE